MEIPVSGMEEVEDTSSAFDGDPISGADRLLACASHSNTPFTIVLDDYNYVEDERVHALVEHFVMQAPPAMHLILTSRTMPPFPLSKLRSRNQLLELSTETIGFTPSEAGDYFSRSLNIQLPESTIASLQNKTEGWIAGLQIVGLSLRSGKQLTSVLASLSGENYRIFDYFSEEVIDDLPTELRSFLIKTSLMDSLNPDLCDFLLGIDDSRNIISILEQQCLFLTPLDDVRYWFRYHQLFGDFLRTKLERDHSEDIPYLHRMASAWLLEHGFLEQAIPHLLASKEYDATARALEESYAGRSVLNFNVSLVQRWVNELPYETMLHHPKLIEFVMLLKLVQGNAKELESYIFEFSDTIDEALDTGVFRSTDTPLRETLGMIKAIVSCVQGRYEEAIAYYERQGGAIVTGSECVQGMLYHFLHYAYFAQGDHKNAENMLKRAIRRADEENLVQEHLSSLSLLGQLYRNQGNLDHAASLYEHALTYARARNADPYIMQLIDVCLGDIYQQRLQLAEADRHLAEAKASFAVRILDPARYDLREWNFIPSAMLTLTRNFILHEDWPNAERCIAHASALFEDCYPVPFLNARLNAMRARIWMASNNKVELEAWIGEAHDRLTAGEAPSFVELVTLAHTYCHIGKPREALSVLDEVQRTTPVLFLKYYDTERHIVKAVALAQSGNRVSARVPLITAAEQAKDEGRLEVFTGFPYLLRSLLQDAIDDLTSNPHRKKTASTIAFLRKIMATYADADNREASRIGEQQPSYTSLVPLRPREEEILRLLAEGKRAKQISAELFISLNTTQTHIKSIYSKLDVHTREEAISKAFALGIL